MKKIALSLIYLILAFFANAQGPKFEWVKQIGNNLDEYTQTIAIDAKGNVYSVGRFQGTVDFDPGSGTFNLTADGPADDVFVLKLDARGHFVWAKRIGGNFDDMGISIDTDKSGNVYIGGSFERTVDFDPGTGTFYMTNPDASYNALFILKLDETGNFIWARSIAGIGDVNLISIKIDSSADMYAIGDFAGIVDFDPGAGIFKLNPSPVQDAFILKLDSLGGFKWVRNFGGKLRVYLSSIALDESNNVFTSGTFEDTVDFDPGIGTYFLKSSIASKGDSYITKLDSSGGFVWAKSIGTSGSGGVKSIVVDQLKFIHAFGSFQKEVDFDPGTDTFNLTSLGSSDDFILKLDSIGNFISAKSIGGTKPEGAVAMTIDDKGDLYLAGHFNGDVDFDPGPEIFNLTSSGLTDIFVMKMNSILNFVWVEKVGGYSTDLVTSLKLDPSGNLYCTGFFSGTVDFDSGGNSFKLTSSGATDVFIYKLSQDTFITLFVDSVSDISCTSSKGYAAVHFRNGKSPYNYLWNTAPPTNGPVATFTKPGLYSVTATDADSNVRITSLMINGPSFHSGFDLSANFVPGTFRPGLSTPIYVDGINDGCSRTSGRLSIVMDTLVSYDKATPKPDLITRDTLIWDFTDLTYDSKPIIPIIFVTPDKTATTGDTVCFDVIITPIMGDSNSKNNIKRYCYPVRNSYDPNIKSVYPAGACKEKFALKNEVLTYTVQFQNTGSADAIDIYILDSLDSDLDMNTLRVIGQSHQPMITEVLPGRVLKFRFDNIHLPDSGTDEKGSHGYVIYEIMPNNGLPNGTTVKGKAGIYFDFNPPVMTNEVKNTLVSIIPSCNVGIESLPEKLPSIRVYPNPTPGHLTVDLQQSGTVAIYDMVGNLVYEKICSFGQNTLDIFTLANGIYLLKANGVGVRLVKVE